VALVRTCWRWAVHAGVWLERVGPLSIIPIFPADVGYTRQGRQERDCGVEDGGGTLERAEPT
jgi:hypothetical protein